MKLKTYMRYINKKKRVEFKSRPLLVVVYRTNNVHMYLLDLFLKKIVI